MPDDEKAREDTPDEPEMIPLEPEPTPPKPAPFKEGLLDDFDEDADLERDPEVEEAIKSGGRPKPAEGKPTKAEAPKVRPDFVLPMPGGWRLPAILGTIAFVAALVFTGINTPHRPIAFAVLVAFYNMTIHTGTGVAAVMIASVLTERRFSRFELAAARMFLAVTVFGLVASLDIPIPGRLDEIALGALAYAAIVWLFFRLPRRETLILIACHFGLWLAVAAGQHLQVLMARAGA